MFSTAAPGRAGMHHARHAVVRGKGDADDLAAVLGDEGLGRRGMGHVPSALDVQLGDRAEPLRRDRLGGSQELAAGVVDEQVEAAVPLEQAGDEAGDRLLVADVGGHRLRRTADRLDGRLRLLERFGPAAAADDDGAEPGELEGGLPTEPGTRPPRRGRPTPRAGRERRSSTAGRSRGQPIAFPARDLVRTSSAAPGPPPPAGSLRARMSKLKAEAKALDKPLPGGG